MKIELEPNAAGSLAIQIPPRGSAEAQSHMVTLKGPQSIVNEYAERLCAEYSKDRMMRPVKLAKSSSA